MTLRQLQYFVAIVDAGLNVTLAAQRCHATQPGLSKQIRQLEDALGFSLFARRGRSLQSLTGQGRSLLAQAREVVEGAAALRAQARVLAGAGGQPLRVGASPAAARHLLPGPLAQLEQRVRDLQVQLQILDTQQSAEALRRGSLDLALASTTIDQPPQARCLPLSRWQRIALLPAGHALCATDPARPLTLEQLALHPLLTYTSAQHADSSFQRAFAARGLKPRIALAAADGELLREHVRQGLGIGILAPTVIAGNGAGDGAAAGGAGNGDLHWRSIEAGLPACVTWLLLPPGGTLSAPAALLVRLLGIDDSVAEPADADG